MNTLLAARPARSQAVDVLFTLQSKNDIETKAEDTSENKGRRKGDSSGSSSGGMRFLNLQTPQVAEPVQLALPFAADISKLSLDLNTTRTGAPAHLGQPTIFNVNLLARIARSAESLWRNPVSARISKWGRREVMHIFNGVFHQSIDDFERYETFGRCYTSPDPFRNDDPPWVACFCR